MEIFLNKHITSFTGSIGRGFGYSIRRTKTGRFISTRNAKGYVPPDGHWRFIIACAELARMGLHIADICVSAKELREAISEAGRFYGDRLVKAPAQHIYNASDVIDYKKRYGLQINSVMSKKTKVSLSSMLDKLQDIEKYKTPHQAFGVILYGWCVKRRQTTAWLYQTRKRDIITYAQAKDFAQYCLQKDWLKLMPI